MCKKGILCIALWIVIGLALVPISAVDAAPPAPWDTIALPEKTFEPCDELDPYETAGGGNRDDSFSYASPITMTGQPGPYLRSLAGQGLGEVRGRERCDLHHLDR